VIRGAMLMAQFLQGTKNTLAIQWLDKNENENDIEIRKKMWYLRKRIVVSTIIFGVLMHTYFTDLYQAVNDGYIWKLLGQFKLNNTSLLRNMFSFHVMSMTGVASNLLSGLFGSHSRKIV
jgi:hypothetical protein